MPIFRHPRTSAPETFRPRPRFRAIPGAALSKLGFAAALAGSLGLARLTVPGAAIAADVADSAATTAAAPTAAGANDPAEVEMRLADDARYLAADEREGRGVGTQGLEAAADFIAKEFAKAGLKTDLWNGGPFQKFNITTGQSLGSPNSLAFVGPKPNSATDELRFELSLETDFTPLAIGGSGTFDLPLVFVGYGITANKEEYDDYAGVDVKGKAVLVLRHEPQQGNPHSVFEGTEPSRHAAFARKASNAYEHGAAAVIFCSDEHDLRKSAANWEKRWCAAVDELAQQQAKLKGLEHPTDETLLPLRDQIDHTADDIQRAAAACELRLAKCSSSTAPATKARAATCRCSTAPAISPNRWSRPRPAKSWARSKPASTRTSSLIASSSPAGGPPASRMSCSGRSRPRTWRGARGRGAAER